MTALCGGVTRSSSGGTIDSILYVVGLTLMLSCFGSCCAVVSTSRLKSERIRLTVSEPIATANAHRIVNVSSADTPASRVRIGTRSNAAVRRLKKCCGAGDGSRAAGSGSEDVARSSDRVQQAGGALGLELAA